MVFRGCRVWRGAWWVEGVEGIVGVEAGLAVGSGGEIAGWTFLRWVQKIEIRGGGGAEMVGLGGEHHYVRYPGSSLGTCQLHPRDSTISISPNGVTLPAMTV